MRYAIRFHALCGVLLLAAFQVHADNAAEMAKKMQDPLANISAVMTDNDILFKFDMGGGFGIETGIGAYANVVKPDGVADWKINWTVNFLLP